MSEPSSTAPSLAPSMSESLALPSPLPSLTSNDARGSPSTKNNLYLFAFLATLILMLGISCGIILRSFALRRRLHRQMEEAMGAGVFFSPRQQGSSRRRFGMKPKLHNAWTSDTLTAFHWKDILPLAAQHIRTKRRAKQDCHCTSTPSRAVANENTSLRALLQLDNSVTKDQHKLPERYVPGPTVLQVTILVSMPTSRHSLLYPSHEPVKFSDSQAPEVVLGVTRLPSKLLAQPPVPPP